MNVGHTKSFTLWDMGAVISILRPKEQDTSSQLAEIETKLKTLGEKRARVLRRREALYTKTRKYG